MRKLMKQIKIALILSFVLVLTPTLKADLPVDLQPGSPNAFWCTDKAGAIKVADAFDENVDCHKQIGKSVSGPDWSTILVSAALGLLVGFVIGSASSR